jgi:hypothetical protein
MSDPYGPPWSVEHYSQPASLLTLLHHINHLLKLIAHGNRETLQSVVTRETGAKYEFAVEGRWLKQFEMEM